MSNMDTDAKTRNDQEAETGADLVEVPRALLERLLDRVDDLADELARYRTENERDKATLRQDDHEAIEKTEGEGSGEPADGESGKVSSGNDAVTPMDRIPSVRRGRRHDRCHRLCAPCQSHRLALQPVGVANAERTRCEGQPEDPPPDSHR